MIGVLRSELIKLTSTRLWWILALVLLGYVAFTSGLLAGLFGALGDQLSATPNAPTLPPESLPPIVYSTVTAVGYVIPLILGAMSVTSEFRYQTLTPTFLAVPRRGRALAAKLAVLAMAGAGLGVVGIVASVGVGASVLALTGHATMLDSADTWLLVGRAILAMSLWAIIGVGVGSLIPNQLASIIVVLAFTQFLEPILRFGASIWDWTAAIGKFLPGAASDALVGSSIFTSLGASTTNVQSLEWWQGGLVLLGIGAVLSVAGMLTTWRRDVT